MRAKQLEEVWPRATPPSPRAALTLPPSASLECFLPTAEYSPRSAHDDWSHTAIALQRHTAADGTSPGRRHRVQQQDDDSVTTAVAIGPWGSEESPMSTIGHLLPSREWGLAASSTSISCDHVGSRCNSSVETPITYVHPSRQAPPTCPPPEQKMLHDSGRAKRLALIICGSDPGKLDPGASLQAVSISPRSPRPAGPMTSSLGVQFRQTCTRHSSSSSSSGRIRGSNANVSAGTATTPTTLTTPTATTSASEHGGISKLDEIATDNCHRHTATVPRGRECTTLENRKWKCQQDQLNGNVSNRQESAKVGDASPPAQLQNKGACATTCSRTVFVRSRQWGVRLPNRTYSFHTAAAEDGVLRVHQLHVSGGKRQRPFVTSGSSTHGRAARGRSASTELFQWQTTNVAAGRNERRTGNMGGDNPHWSGELPVFPASVASAGHGQGQGPTGREKTAEAAKAPSDNPASSVVANPEQSRFSSLVRWRMVRPPSGSKLRCDSRRWLNRERSPCRFASTEGTKRQQTPRGTELPVAAKIENGMSAPVASGVASERGVPQPLSVVAVWARAPSPRWAAPDTELTSRAGAHCSKTTGPRVGRAREGRQDPQVTAATECVQNARPVGAASRVLASTSPPEGAKTESYRCTRLRPSSAGLLYFRASLNRDGERVAATPREGRERHILGHDKAATCRLWSQGDKRAAPEPISQQSDATTTDKAGAVGDTPGLMVESVMAARRGLANRATGSGDFVFSKAASGEEGCAHDPNNTATPAGMIVDGKPSCLQVAISSGFLQSPRVEHGTEGTAGADILRVDGVGGNPRMWGSIPSEGLTRHQSPAEVDRGKTAAATAGKDPLLPCAGSGLPAASSGETMTTAVAAEAASGTCNEVERLHRHVSTLEMISAMAHVPASVPPDCVQGVEISIPAGKPRPASSPPRRILTRAGVDNCAIDDGRFNQEMPPLYKREKFRGNEGGTAKRVAAPCTSLLRSFSWAAGDESTDAASRCGGVASPTPTEQSQDLDFEDQTETSCAEDLQLHVNETSENARGPCSARTTTTNTCNGLGWALPDYKGGDGVREEHRQPLTTPFSRYVHRKSNGRHRPSNTGATPPPRKPVVTSPRRPPSKRALAQHSTSYRHAGHDSQIFLRAVLTGVSQKRAECKHIPAHPPGREIEHRLVQ